MPRRKQSVRNGIWKIGGRKRKRNQRGGAIPFGLIASLAAPVLGESAKPVFKTILGRGTKRRRKW